MSLGLAIVVAAGSLVVLLGWLIVRLPPARPLPPPTPMRTRAGTIPMVRCGECGELVERHRAVLVAGDWLCLYPDECPSEEPAS